MKRTKIINTTRVLNYIWIRRVASRIDIAKALDVNKSTVSNIVAELMDAGIIVEDSVGEAGNQGGRKPINLRINSSFGCVVGLELRPESYTAIGTDLQGMILFVKTESMEISGSNLPSVFSEILQRIEHECRRVNRPLVGIGTGIAGPLDPYRQIIKYSIPMHITSSYDFYDQVSRHLPIPVFLENDANCGAWGELAFHRHRDMQNFIFTLVEFRTIDQDRRVHEKTSVGLGIVINGSVYYGRDYTAGEFRSVFRGEEHHGQFSFTAEEAQRLEQDPELMDRFIRELSKNLAMVINTFNISQIFLGGHIVSYQSKVQKILREEIRANWPYPDPWSCEILFSSLNDKAVAYGAAGMVLDRLFMNLELADNRIDMRYRNTDLVSLWLNGVEGPFRPLPYEEVISRMGNAYTAHH